MEDIKIYKIKNIKDIDKIDDPCVGSIFYVEDTASYYSVKTLKTLDAITSDGNKVKELFVDTYTGLGSGSGLTSEYVDKAIASYNENLGDLIPVPFIQNIVTSTTIVEVGDGFWTNAEYDNQCDPTLDTFLDITISGTEYNGLLFDSFYISNTESFPYQIEYNYKAEPVNLGVYDSNWNKINITALDSFRIYQKRYNSSISDTQIESVGFNKISEVPYRLQAIITGRDKILDINIINRLLYNNLLKRIPFQTADVNYSPFEDNFGTTNNLVKFNTNFYIYNKYNEVNNRGKGFKINLFEQLGLDPNGTEPRRVDVTMYYPYKELPCKITVVNPKLEVVKTIDLSTDVFTEKIVVQEIYKGDYYFLFAHTSDAKYEYIDLTKLYLFTTGDNAPTTKKFENFISADNNIPYEPTGIYNPVTKKYVDELINTTMLAADEMFIMVEPYLTETYSTEKEGSKIVDLYVAMVQRRLKTIDEVPTRYRDEVRTILET